MPRSAEPPDQNLPSGHVGIGDCCFALKPVLLSTVLGSCVSVTFHHPGRGVGGMFHAMLPEKALAKMRQRPCLFADGAVDAMLERFRASGMKPSELVVKLFGGANTMQENHPEHLREMLDVGRKNVEAARAALTAHGLTPVSEDVLGPYGRKLFFNTRSGEVWLRYLNPEQTRRVVVCESHGDDPDDGLADLRDGRCKR